MSHCGLHHLALLLLVIGCGSAPVFAQTSRPKIKVPAAGTTTDKPRAEASSKFDIPKVTGEFLANSTEPELASKILELRQLLPEDLRKPANMSIEQLHKLVDQTLLMSERYIVRFPEGDGRKSVLPAFAKLMVVNNSRFFMVSNERWKQQNNGEPMPDEARKALRARYFDRVLTVVEEAIRLNPEGKLNEELWTIRGQANWFAGRFDGAIESYQKVLALYPTSPKAAENLLALLNAYLTSRQYDQSLNLANQFLSTYPKHELVSHVYQLKAKALYEAGRPEDALAWWLSCQRFLHLAGTGSVKIGEETVAFDPPVRQSFRRYYDEALFMTGFFKGYLGDLEGAREAFSKAVQHMMDQQAMNMLDPRSQVFLGRADKVHNAYLSLVGFPVPPLNISMWLDEVPSQPQAEEGNVSVIILAPYENPRYDETQTTTHELYTPHWHEGLRVTWVADPKGFADVPGQEPRLRSQRDRLGLTFPVGMETERGWPNFIDYQASVGGGTLVVVDKQGKVAWYKMDPTFRDGNLLRKLVRRLLDAP